MSSASPNSRCGLFVAMVTVVSLVIFETLFYFLFVAPVVERGTIDLAADTIAEGIANQVRAGQSCDVMQGRIIDGVERFPKPPDVPSIHRANSQAMMNISFVTGGLVIGVIAWWFLVLHGRMHFPASAIARETLPVLFLFALYDFMYFYYFVRTFSTGSADEFLSAMAQGIADPVAISVEDM
jgi:hypothetical protein